MQIELDPLRWPKEGPERDIVELNALLQVAEFLGDFDVPGYWRCRYGRFGSCKTIELPDFYNDSAWTGPLLKRLIQACKENGLWWRISGSGEITVGNNPALQEKAIYIRRTHDSTIPGLNTALILVIAAVKEGK